MNTTDSGPAGGAALGEVFAATGGALLATAILLYLGWAHRTGRTDVLRRLARFAARDMGFADWAAPPPRCSPPARCSSRCSACTGTSRRTSTMAATRGRSPTPRTT